MKIQVRVGLLLLLLLTSCTHYYYIPNIQNVPLFREKDEGRLSMSYGAGEESNSIEIQGGWSPGKHIGLTSSFIHARSTDISTSDDWGKGSYIDLACGYFTPINEYGVFEIYGGFGGSSQTHQFTAYGSYASGGNKAYLKSNRLFIQPAIGFEFNFLEIAFSARMCRLSFTDVDFSLDSDDFPFDYERLAALSTDGIYYFVEPAATLRIGWKNVKLQVQASFGSFQWDPEIPFESFHFGLGAQVAFGDRYKNKDGVK